jgi:integrase
MAAKLWTIPGKRMKAGREHRVPLSFRTRLKQRISGGTCLRNECG